MPNKISGYKATPALAPIQSTGRNTAVADKAPGAAPAVGNSEQAVDHVTITQSARSLQKLDQAFANAPVVDAAKVASVKQSVTSGTYTINPIRIADKLIKFESGLK